MGLIDENKYQQTRCPSCGGVIGRDCFNVIECAEISRRNSEGVYEDILSERYSFKKNLDLLRGELYFCDQKIEQLQQDKQILIDLLGKVVDEMKSDDPNLSSYKKDLIKEAESAISKAKAINP